MKIRIFTRPNTFIYENKMLIFINFPSFFLTFDRFFGIIYHGKYGSREVMRAGGLSRLGLWVDLDISAKRFGGNFFCDK